MELDAEFAVVGLGAIGSAALWRLAARGEDVIGIEQFAIGHNQGSSHGETRLFRTLCMEAPELVTVARRSQELLRELEKDSASELLRLSGGLFIGTPESDVIDGVVKAADAHGVALERLSRQELLDRFPQHENLDPRDIGLWDPESGAVRPEASIVAAVDAARSAGAQVIAQTAVTDIKFDDSGALVVTPARTFRVGKVIVSTGAWLSKFVPSMPLNPLRTPMTWFAPKPDATASFDLESFPIFVRAVANGDRLWGHGAVFGHAAKIGPEDSPEYDTVDADHVDRGVSDRDWKHISGLLDNYIPQLDSTPSRTTTCMITRSPDMQFQIGPLASEPRLYVAGGDSGHAFKHATGLGEYIAQQLTGETPYVDLSFTDPNRF
ncbi:N-methyl-L-tryptophan oxidase [Brevibacterium sp. 91QC2O2]|uniref:N-methyl-L-tryptophan oxidase n=1 Tax=Brevibacterium sp. 91QC2O2 TaxID=2968458 RepID=UPI00211C1428|nr:N-methyl-L-tryptophan oxidase [Brevibacterium sp. 91QC2O2]